LLYRPQGIAFLQQGRFQLLVQQLGEDFVRR